MDNYQQENFIFVSGELSGIQETVYTISSQGALKTLRARSFMLELLTWHIAYELLQLAGVNTDKPADYMVHLMAEDEIRPGVIYNGGGAFALILADRAGMKKKVDKFHFLMNNWALMEFCGSLFVAIHAQRVSFQMLQTNFKKVWRDQIDALDQQKKRKFWTSDGKLLKYLMQPKMPIQTKQDQHCQITGRDDLPAKEWPPGLNRYLDNAITFEQKSGFSASRSAYHQWVLGEHLARIRTGSPIFRYDHDQVDLTNRSGYLSFPTAKDNNYALYSLNDYNVNPELTWHVGKEVLYAYYVTKIGDLGKYAQQREREAILIDRPDTAESQLQAYTASFIGLSSAAIGADMIGALRMDVDNLGKLFAGIDNPRSLAITSFYYNYFFKSLLNQICMGDCQEDLPEFKPRRLFSSARTNGKSERLNVSVIYSGGDDLFIVGAWNEIIELALDIKQALKCYCEKLLKKYPALQLTSSISGGITIHHPKYPLYQVAHRSKAAETCAKRDSDDIDGNAALKNRISVFHDANKVQRHFKSSSQGHPYRYMLSAKWDKLESDLFPLMQEITKTGRIKKSAEGKTIFELDAIKAQTIDKWFRVIVRFQQSGQMALPTMARILSELRNNLTAQLFEELITRMYRYGDRNFPHLHVALNWLSFLRRAR